MRDSLARKFAAVIYIFFSCLIFFYLQTAHAAKLSPSSVQEPAIYDESKTAVIIDDKQPVFIIKLISNPTTGYSWFLKDYDQTMIKPVKHEYHSPKQEMPGAPGYELWVFRVKSEALSVPRRSVIKMVYARPWEIGQSAKYADFVVTTVAD